MKRFIVFLVLGVGISFFAFAQTTSYSIYEDVLAGLQEFTNGCGPGEWSDELRGLLNTISGNRNACDNHDWAYYTLGVSKEEADTAFYNAMLNGTWNIYIPGLNVNIQNVIAYIFWQAVHSYGDDSYESAQAFSREKFREVHGLEWESYGIKWIPSEGKVLF